MKFKTGDRVRYNPYMLPSDSPEWRGRTGTVISLDGPHPGQAEHWFAEVKMDGDGTIRKHVRTAELVPAR